MVEGCKTDPVINYPCQLYIANVTPRWGQKVVSFRYLNEEVTNIMFVTISKDDKK